MHHPAFLRVLLSFALALGLLAGSAPARAEAQPGAKTDFLVNDAGDGHDAAPGSGGCSTAAGTCTLRAAIEEGNATAGAHTITFSGDLSITPPDELPEIIHNDTLIDGGGHTITLSSPDAKVNLEFGLKISASNCAIRGLAIDGFQHNIIVEGATNTIGTNGDGVNDLQERNYLLGASGNGLLIMGDNNIVAGNYIGVTPAGGAAGNGTGILVDGGNTRIGTDGNGTADTAEGNIISGNTNDGIILFNLASGSVIAGNRIGVNPSGTAALPNGGAGIQVSDAGKAPCNNLRIGTDGNGSGDADEGNTISGNGNHGIQIDIGSGHVIAGNRIGVNASGTAALPNSASGIYLPATAGGGIRIGTNGNIASDALERNLISGNTHYGIEISNDNVTIAGNYIGTDITGTLPIPNTLGGIYVADDGMDNILGMNSDGSAGEANEGNLVSGNGGHAIHLNTAVRARVAGNRIGVYASGSAALPNQGVGIRVEHSAFATIGTNGDGTSDALEGNLISGNLGDGLQLFGSATQDSIVQGNTIGLGSDKITPIPNGSSGIWVNGVSNPRIGGLLGGQTNWISGNTLHGIHLETSATNARIVNNRIGLTANGGPAGNGGHGIFIQVQEPIKVAQMTLVNINQIGNNGLAGIYLDMDAGPGHKFLTNQFRMNGGLAIDISPDHVNANDSQDADDGPNDLQNYPLVESVTFLPGNQIRITGSLHTTPVATLTIELYASLEADPSGYGEGFIPINQLSVTTNASGNASFEYIDDWTQGRKYLFFSALATAANGSTSEFGPLLEVRTFFLPMVSK